jgi:hypothetical protein
MTVGFISPALRRGSPTDLTVRADRATLSDAAVEFDAADKALLRTASDPAFFTLAGKTVSIWCKLDDSADRRIFTQDENTLRYDPNEDAFIWDYNGFEDSYQTADALSLSHVDLTDWVHIVIVARSAGVKIYLNGILDTNDDSEIPVTGGDGNLYQFGGPLNGVWFDGKFDSSAIWEREFTDAEVLELYNDGDGFTYSQLPANLSTGILHAWDFSARSSTGVWFDAVGGANLTEEFGDITSYDPTFASNAEGMTGNGTLISLVSEDDDGAGIPPFNGIKAASNLTDRHRYILPASAFPQAGTYNFTISLFVPTGSVLVGRSVQGMSATSTPSTFQAGFQTYTGTLIWDGVSIFRFFGTFGGADYTDAVSYMQACKIEYKKTSIPLATGITAGLARAYGTDIGDSVSLWLDRSSEGNDLAQTSIVSQPMLVEVDGVNWLRFDGVDDRLTRPASPWASIFAGSTVVMVIGTLSNVTAQYQIYDNHQSGVGRTGISIQNSRIKFGWRNDVTTARAETGTSVSINTSYVVVGRILDGAVTFRVNGSLATGTDIFDSSSAGFISIGARANAVIPFNGKIGELMLTLRALSDTEIIRIERSLAAKYGITLAS